MVSIVDALAILEGIGGSVVPGTLLRLGANGRATNQLSVSPFCHR